MGDSTNAIEGKRAWFQYLAGVMLSQLGGKSSCFMLVVWVCGFKLGFKL